MIPNHTRMLRASSMLCLFFIGGTSVTLAAPGDTCTDPFIIASLPTTVYGSTLGFSNDFVGCAMDQGAPDVVYSFTPIQSMSVDISLCDSQFDTVLYVFEGSCGGATIACDDDGCGALQSRINGLWLTAGVAYYIVIDGYNLDAGNYILSITTAVLSGDTCANPFIIDSPIFSDQGSTCGFGADTAGYCSDDGGAPDVVYAFTPQHAMDICISLQGSDYDTVLYVLEETCTGTAIACSDDYWGLQSYLRSVSLSPGVEYYIVIDGFNGACGNYSLALSLPGEGTETDPYQISSPEQLTSIGSDTDLLDKWLILTRDINMQGYVFTTAVIAPDTEDDTSPEFNGIPFTGVFDGNGHTITNLNIIGGDNDYIGLFGTIGWVGVEGIVKNLVMVNCDVGGDCIVGTLAGSIWSHYSSVSNCYASGAVTGTGYEIGGLAGLNAGGIYNCSTVVSVSGTEMSYEVGGLAGANVSIISNCSSTGNVSGDLYVGGMVGENAGDVSNCYSAGSVSGTGVVGGLVGYNRNGIVSNCYATGIVSGMGSAGGLVGYDDYGYSLQRCYFLDTAGPDNGLGTPLTDAQMRQQSSFVDWDFVGEYNNGAEDFWQTLHGGGYPRLRFEMVASFGGKGTPDEPYEISTADQLVAIGVDADLLDKHFILTNDIDLSGCVFTTAVIASEWDDSTLWFDTPFTGVFDGDTHTVNNLTITGGDNIGLFGIIGTEYEDAVVKNLGVVGCDISGDSDVGGLAGRNYSSVSNCYSTGSVNGTAFFVGGLVGRSIGSVSNCYSDGIVDGYADVGGLLGYNIGIVTNCCSSSTVSGTSSVGGLLGGSDSGEVINCYAVGIVSGLDAIGGFIGVSTFEGPISNSYFLDTAGPDNSYGTPLTDAQMKQQSSFFDWDFTNTDGDPAVWMMLRPGEDYPRLAWQTIYAGDIAGLYGVNGVDFAELSRNWLQSGCPNRCEDADLDASGEVDLDDLILFLENWLMQ